MDKQSEIAKLRWAIETSKGGSTPMRRIYSTMRQLGSSCSYKQAEAMVKELEASGEIVATPHPLHDGEYFYAAA